MIFLTAFYVITVPIVAPTVSMMGEAPRASLWYLPARTWGGILSESPRPWPGLESKGRFMSQFPDAWLSRSIHLTISKRA
jgi:hypothetical protein